MEKPTPTLSNHNPSSTLLNLSTINNTNTMNTTNTNTNTTNTNNDNSNVIKASDIKPINSNVLSDVTIKNNKSNNVDKLEYPAMSLCYITSSSKIPYKYIILNSKAVSELSLFLDPKQKRVMVQTFTVNGEPRAIIQLSNTVKYQITNDKNISVDILAPVVDNRNYRFRSNDIISMIEKVFNVTNNHMKEVIFKLKPTTLVYDDGSVVKTLEIIATDIKYDLK